MALSFKSPTPRHRYIISKEKAALTKHFKDRDVPQSREGRLLLASWNIANLGVQGRTAGARSLIAHILKRFDLVAIQEVKDRYKPFLDVLKRMGPGFDYVMSDPAGNTERLAYVYRKNKVQPRNLFGEVSLRDKEFPTRTIRVPWRDRGEDKVDVFKNLRFRPFDRNPFIGSFRAERFDLMLANVHLYFGAFRDSKTKTQRQKYARRVLEIYALARWADRRFDSGTRYDKDILLLGDMNVPAMDKDEATYKALLSFGWQPVDYTSKTGGSNLGNDKTYDQITLAPGALQRRVRNHGVFDFDNAVFKPLWKKLERQLPKSRVVGSFNAHVKHHISDHRPLWVQLDIT